MMVTAAVSEAMTTSAWAPAPAVSLSSATKVVCAGANGAAVISPSQAAAKASASPVPQASSR